MTYLTPPQYATLAGCHREKSHRLAKDGGLTGVVMSEPETDGRRVYLIPL